MKDLARVLKVEENCIKVQLLDSSACINCPWQKSCTSGKKILTVKNPIGLSLNEDDCVKLALPAKAKNLLGIFAFVFPIAFTVLGFFLSFPLAALFKREATQVFQFAVSLIFLFAAGTFNAVLSRKEFHLITPEIIQIL